MRLTDYSEELPIFSHVHGSVKRVKVSSHKVTPPLMGSIGHSTIARRRYASASIPSKNLTILTECAVSERAIRNKRTLLMPVPSSRQPRQSLGHIFASKRSMRFSSGLVNKSKDDLYLIHTYPGIGASV